jgi:hypothetical protein
MIRRMLPVMLGLLLAASPAVVGKMIQHSGLVLSANAKLDTLTLSEMGPWHGPATRPTRREVHLTLGTVVRLATRRGEPGGFTRPYVEQPASAADLRPGDFATVTRDGPGRQASGHQGRGGPSGRVRQLTRSLGPPRAARGATAEPPP